MVWKFYLLLHVSCILNWSKLWLTWLRQNLRLPQGIKPTFHLLRLHPMEIFCLLSTKMALVFNQSSLQKRKQYLPPFDDLISVGCTPCIKTMYRSIAVMGFLDHFLAQVITWSSNRRLRVFLWLNHLGLWVILEGTETISRDLSHIYGGKTVL